MLHAAQRVITTKLPLSTQLVARVLRLMPDAQGCSVNRHTGVSLSPAVDLHRLQAITLQTLNRTHSIHTCKPVSNRGIYIDISALGSCREPFDRSLESGNCVAAIEIWWVLGAGCNLGSMPFSL